MTTFDAVFRPWRKTGRQVRVVREIRWAQIPTWEKQAQSDLFRVLVFPDPGKISQRVPIFPQSGHRAITSGKKLLARFYDSLNSAPSVQWVLRTRDPVALASSIPIPTQNMWLGTRITQPSDLPRIAALEAAAFAGRRVLWVEPRHDLPEGWRDLDRYAGKGIHWVIFSGQANCDLATLDSWIEWTVGRFIPLKVETLGPTPVLPTSTGKLGLVLTHRGADYTQWPEYLQEWGRHSSATVPG